MKVLQSFKGLLVYAKYMCVYIYIYTHTCIYTYIHTNIYIYTYACICVCVRRVKLRRGLRLEV